jgi:hypothetical protein
MGTDEDRLKSRQIEEIQMIDPETGLRVLPTVPYVFTTTRMFGPDVAHHVVPVTDSASDRKRMRLFERKIGGDIGRNYDRTNDVVHHSQTKSDFDRYHYDDGTPVPTTEHASLDAFLKAIGYSWSRNAYKAADEKAAQSAEG